MDRQSPAKIESAYQRRLARNRRYHAAHRERILERKRAYRKANAEKIAAKKREYHLKNRERRLAQMKVAALRRKIIGAGFPLPPDLIPRAAS